MELSLAHKLKKITFARTHTDSESLDIRYIPRDSPPDYYDLLYQNTALTARSVIVELGDEYEDVAGGIVRFTITGTNTKSWRPRVIAELFPEVK